MGSGNFKLYILIMRGTPLLLQLMFVYFAPYYWIGLNWDRFIAAIVAFSLNYAAYFAEIWGGIDLFLKANMKQHKSLVLPKPKRL